MSEINNNQIIFLKPIFKDMIWGGNKLASEFNYQIPNGSIGECWAIAAHPNGDVKVTSENFKNYTLDMLWKEKPELFGWLKSDVFPLLVKIIDAKSDLSVQVHPDDNYAYIHENKSLGKTECWYVLDCDENATIIIGHNAKDKNELKKMIEGKQWTELLREIKIHKGDFFQIEPGCIHAIKGGTMILETQQNSDITYRLYDYERKTADDRLRELHTEKAFDVITAPFVPNISNKKVQKHDGFVQEILVNCKYYSVEKISISTTAEILQNHKFMNVSVIEGTGTVDGIKIEKGTHFILPNNYGDVQFEGSMELIISYV